MTRALSNFLLLIHLACVSTVNAPPLWLVPKDPKKLPSEIEGLVPVDQEHPLPLPPVNLHPTTNGLTGQGTFIIQQQPAPHFSPPPFVRRTLCPHNSPLPPFGRSNVFVQESDFSHIPNSISWIIEVFGYNPQEVVVAFDFDRVLTTGRQLFKWRVDAFDPRASQVIKQLQGMGVRILGVTRRAPNDGKGLARVLGELDINFDWLDDSSCKGSHKAQNVRVSSGVLQTFWRPKIPELIQLLRQNKLNGKQLPRQLFVLVDDHFPNLFTCASALSEEQNPPSFLGIFYRDPDRKRDFIDRCFEFLP